MTIEMISGIVGLAFSLFAIYIVSKTLLVWQGVLRDGLWLFLLGFSFLGAGFVWDLFTLVNYMPVASDFIFAFGMALLAGGAYKMFTFVYPS